MVLLQNFSVASLRKGGLTSSNSISHALPTEKSPPNKKKSSLEKWLITYSIKLI